MSIENLYWASGKTLTLTNLTGAGGDIDDDPEAGTDSDWLLATGAGGTIAKIGFATPSSQPSGAASAQRCVFRVRKDAAGGNTVYFSVQLWYDGGLKLTPIVNQTISSGGGAGDTTGVTFDFNWGAGLVDDPSTVELRIMQTAGHHTGDANVRFIEVGGAKWEAAISSRTGYILMRCPADSIYQTAPDGVTEYADFHAIENMADMDTGLTPLDASENNSEYGYNLQLGPESLGRTLNSSRVVFPFDPSDAIVYDDEAAAFIPYSSLPTNAKITEGRLELRAGSDSSTGYLVTNEFNHDNPSLPSLFTNIDIPEFVGDPGAAPWGTVVCSNDATVSPAALASDVFGASFSAWFAVEHNPSFIGDPAPTTLRVTYFRMRLLWEVVEADLPAAELGMDLSGSAAIQRVVDLQAPASMALGAAGGINADFHLGADAPLNLNGLGDPSTNPGFTDTSAFADLELGGSLELRGRFAMFSSDDEPLELVLTSEATMATIRRLDAAASLGLATESFVMRIGNLSVMELGAPLSLSVAALGLINQGNMAATAPLVLSGTGILPGKVSMDGATELALSLVATIRSTLGLFGSASLPLSAAGSVQNQISLAAGATLELDSISGITYLRSSSALEENTLHVQARDRAVLVPQRQRAVSVGARERAVAVPARSRTIIINSQQRN